MAIRELIPDAANLSPRREAARSRAALTKTSLMLGLGETDAEVERTLDDIRGVYVDVITLGQYMRPSPHHLPVQRFVTPDEFRHHRELALGKGFLEAVAGPLVRSSYRAERVLEHNNLGLRTSARPTRPVPHGCAAVVSVFDDGSYDHANPFVTFFPDQPHPCWNHRAGGWCTFRHPERVRCRRACSRAPHR